MRVVSRWIGSAAVAGMLTFTTFILALAGSWISGWGIRVPGLLKVGRASDDAAGGVVFDPNTVGLVMLAGLLTILLAAWRPAAAATRKRS